jgi:hypothetical protein
MVMAGDSALYLYEYYPLATAVACGRQSLTNITLSDSTWLWPGDGASCDPSLTTAAGGRQRLLTLQ